MTFYEADSGASRGVLLVLAHGAGGGQTHPFMVRYAHGLAQRGIDVVTFDFPYMQAGRKAPDRAPVLEEAFRRVIVEAVQDARGANKRLLIGGKSMGGRMATHLAAAPDAWPSEAPALSGVVVLGYPLNPPGGPSKASPDRTSHLSEIEVPMLIVQGTRDAFGGAAVVEAALKQTAGAKAGRFIVHAVQGGDHSLAAKYDQDVLDVVAAFASSM